ncbi:unnamed protein product [Musa banksii]
MGVANKISWFLKMNPIGKAPVLETPDLTRSKADNPLYGTSLVEYAHIEQWIDFAPTEIAPRVGFGPYLAGSVEEAAISSLKRALGALNTHLTSNISRRPCCYFGRYFYDL